MNYYIPKSVNKESRLYIANEDDISCAYLTMSQVRQRKDLKDYIPAMKLLQSDSEKKKDKKDRKKESRKKLFETIKTDPNDNHLPF